MGVHRETGNRVNGREGETRQRVEATCKQCGKRWHFYRYPKQRRPEYDVCSDCATRNWLREHTVAVP